MRVAFIGCVAFSRAALEHAIGLPGVELAAVISRRESAFNADFSVLDDVAARVGAPVLHADTLSQPEMADWLRRQRPDVVYCFGWSQLLGREVLAVPPLGVIGFHPAALPNNRGRHPLIWALALGLDETASTFFIMDGGADTGDIISQRHIAIGPEDDAGTLYAKVTAIALEQISEISRALQDSTVQRRSQAAGSGNGWRKRSKVDGQIDWRMPARGVHNLVRALARPYVGAHCVYEGREIKVWRTKLHNNKDRYSEPGKVLACEVDEIIVKCGEGVIGLVDHEFGRLPQPGSYL